MKRLITWSFREQVQAVKREASVVMLGFFLFIMVSYVFTYLFFYTTTKSVKDDFVMQIILLIISIVLCLCKLLVGRLSYERTNALLQLNLPKKNIAKAYVFNYWVNVFDLGILALYVLHVFLNLCLSIKFSSLFVSSVFIVGVLSYTVFILQSSILLGGNTFLIAYVGTAILLAIGCYFTTCVFLLPLGTLFLLILGFYFILSKILLI